MHLIRFASRKEHKRAIMTLLTLSGESLGLPDYQMVVTEEHVQALKDAKIPFDLLSRTQPNGTNTAPIQS